MKNTRLMFLYHLYNGRNHLLYIGITNNPNKRFQHHAKAQPWWKEVTRYELEEVPLSEARTLERHFIRDRHPRYNVHHNIWTLKERQAPYVPPEPFAMNQPLPRRNRPSTLDLTPPGRSLCEVDAAYAMGFTQLNFSIIADDPTFPKDAEVLESPRLMYDRDELRLWFDYALKAEADELAARPPPPPPPPDPYPMWTIEQAGRASGWGVTAIRRAKKEDPTFPHGQMESTSKRLRYRRDEVEAWLNKAWDDAVEASKAAAS